MEDSEKGEENMQERRGGGAGGGGGRGGDKAIIRDNHRNVRPRRRIDTLGDKVSLHATQPRSRGVAIDLYR